MDPIPPTRPVPDRIAQIHAAWTRQARLFRAIHISLILLATTSSILASAGILKDFHGVANPLAIVAAIAIGLVSAVALGDKANAFRSAWRLLSAAIMRFEEEPDFTVEQLIKTYEEAEKQIGDIRGSSKP